MLYGKGRQAKNRKAAEEMSRAMQIITGRRSHGPTKWAIRMVALPICLILLLLSVNIFLWISIDRFRGQLESELDAYLHSVAALGANLFSEREIALVQREVYGKVFRQSVERKMGQLREYVGLEAIWRWRRCSGFPGGRLLVLTGRMP